MPLILIADDDPDMRDVLTVVLVSAGLEVVTAADGITALWLAKQHRPDAVLADFDMPGLNGIQLCNAIREHDSLRSVPVAILSGYLVSGDIHIHQFGSCTVMLQPRTNKDLVTIMNRLIKQGGHDHDREGRCMIEDPADAPATPLDSTSACLVFSPPRSDL